MSDSRQIVLDGISGSGKTTLISALAKARNYIDFHIPRSTPSAWVYAAIENRSVCLVDLRNYETKLQELLPTTLVTLTCDPYIALRRKESMPNEIIEPNIAIANKLFMVYHNYLTSIKRRIVVCTNHRSVDECVELILKRVLA